MNERIRELAEQVGATIGEGFDGTKGFVYGITMSPEELEKFAELIVRECISIVDDAERGGSNEVWDNAVKFIRRDLKQHFGVEQ